MSWKQGLKFFVPKSYYPDEIYRLNIMLLNEKYVTEMHPYSMLQIASNVGGFLNGIKTAIVFTSSIFAFKLNQIAMATYYEKKLGSKEKDPNRFGKYSNISYWIYENTYLIRR